MLRSRAAWTLLCFWALLALVLLIPSPLRDRMLSAGDQVAARPATPGAPSLPGLPAPVPSETPAGEPKRPVAAESSVEPIQDPKGAMIHFHRALARTAAKQPGAITRVLHYGDSLIDLDYITGPLRRSLQRRFGDAGHGFVLAAKPWRWYNHLGIGLAAGEGWKHHRLVGRVRDRHLGLGGAAIESEGRAWVRITSTEATRASRVEVHYLRMPGGGELDLSVDGKPAATVKTDAPQRRSGIHVLALPDTPHVVRLRARGKVRLFGLVLERKGPGVTWENLTMVSVRLNQLATLDHQHWSEQLKQRRPDLVVFQFGANDTIYFGGDLDAYRREVVVVLGRVRRALPEASCLIVGPLDRLQRDSKGRLRSPSVVRRVSDEQKRAAFEAGCAFWDGQRAMGGPGSMRSFADRGLALKDLVHLNVKGSVALADLFEKALLKGYREHRAK